MNETKSLCRLQIINKDQLGICEGAGFMKKAVPAVSFLQPTTLLLVKLKRNSFLNVSLVQMFQALLAKAGHSDLVNADGTL